MLIFIKNYSHDCLRSKLLMLYILNVTDLIFTQILLSSGYFTEANIFMSSAIQSFSASFMLKVVMPALLLLYLYYRIQSASEGQLKRANMMVSGITGIYLIINVSHLIWFTILPLIIKL
ncbi:DUF5658 family protein [Schinkia sp. CFF1]